MIFASFEIAFTQSIWANVYLVALCLVYLIPTLTPKRIAWLLFMPVIPILGTWMSFYFHGTGDVWHTSWLLSTRIYAYIFLGAIVTFTMPINNLLGSLEQNCHIPSKFVYGTLGAFNFIPRVTQTVKQIQSAALMRGEVLHAWSPQIFFKAVLISLRWSDDLAQSMQSHGFWEQQHRSHFDTYPMPLWNWAVALLALGGLQVVAFSGLG
ncbi:ABC transporter [Agrilactobacillus composti DSM 18527 = JCM 14202]|uniref:ABC transporter n=1 Tax=Agrilactobacillus composti DSM 18527 = JCM 14202 TaxID=1423734 RepID=X0PU97_9LACO|nr:energy-coupling factor transporter transmembrane component T [Agrilactobacillus composti]KRM35551.1 ABC transporter [Agrilactobacillus composti DSM 18527 = JCM 14202]GAF41652.1 transmembrane [Agrilactobacillus composti DSM 18527 = JCM 14202]